MGQITNRIDVDTYAESNMFVPGIKGGGGIISGFVVFFNSGSIGTSCSVVNCPTVAVFIVIVVIIVVSGDCLAC